MKLIVRELQKSFQEKDVLKGVTYTFSSGEITGLLGRNGAGKTTFFNVLYGDLMADGGELFLEENGVERPLQVEDVGMVFSENYLPEFLTGYEFITFYMDLHVTNPHKRGQTVDDYLDFMEISEEDRHRIIKGYSDGMKSKLSLLCLLISRPKVILLDEPLTAVDVVSSIAIKRLLLTLKDDHILILSTHIMALAEDLCDTIALLDKGEMSPLDLEGHKEQFEEKVLEALQGGIYET
ncbi:ATP-binding cassette domain-containing protein [Streptococcus hillyeri]|uniref:ABC transporter ATP-binding protein n=1 Tax=Streptococcus hillyeri TaxID=2282420 RepID=A0A3L9DY40_9STRE|nr:ABC transporter ATP-binding protein [Streptococcus hillyeri]RLY05204.1 ABC transporter ATP-binding protein [Streptococcus hillyeri]